MNDLRITFSVVSETTERLDRFLADQLALSRTQAARLVADGQVSVNGVQARAGKSLARSDEVSVIYPATEPLRTLRPHHIHLDIHFEDDSLIVLNKPAGLVVHPAPGHWDDTLVNALVARGTPLSSLGGRPGIVHRLDRLTSGLMIVAKTDRAHRVLAKALERRKVERIYAVLTWGHLEQPVRVDAAITRHPGDRKRMMVSATGRSAVTHFEPIARFSVCELCRAKLETGRTHQIRVHAAHIGHPVVGDPAYGGGGARRISGHLRSPAEALDRVTPRQALHAASLRFAHPETGEPMAFESDWPPDLADTLTAAFGDSVLDVQDCVLQYLGFFQFK